MSKNEHATSNADADRRPLRDGELDAVTGGVSHGEFVIHKLVDASTPKLYEAA